MNYYNSTQRSTVVVFWLLLVVFAAGKPVGHMAKGVQDISKISLERAQGAWGVNFKIGHHGVKLEARPQVCRSWIKEGLCQVCDREGKNCEGARSCFQNQKDAKISCDSSFCKRNEDYSDEERGIYGFEAEVFGQAGNSEQALIPVVFANKIQQRVKQSGQFCVFDSDWLFVRGMMLLRGKNIELLNSKSNSQQREELQSGAFETTSLKMKGENIGFQQLRGISALVVHSEPLAYKQVSYTAIQSFSLQLTLNQIGVSVPLAMLQKIQSGISSVYFPDNSCKIGGGKIECRDQLKFGGFTDAMLQLIFQQDFKISLPLHLLVSSCGTKECKFLLQKSENEGLVTIGSIIWQVMALQWDTDKKMVWLHRLNNHWANPYKSYKIDLTKKGFLENMFTLLYHIFFYFFYCIFGLAAISLLINCLIKWKEVGRFVKKIFVSKSKSERKAVSQNDQEQYYFGGLTDEVVPRGRKINKLAQTLQDDS